MRTNIKQVPRQLITNYAPPSLPFSLIEKINKLILISREAEYIQHHLAHGFNHNDLNQSAAYARIAALQNIWYTLKAQVDSELFALGHHPGHIITSQAQKMYTQPPNHVYGPASSYYTVDKALERKRKNKETQIIDELEQATKKLRYDSVASVNSDFVESESEEERYSGRQVEPLTCLAGIPLSHAERLKMRHWCWRTSHPRRVVHAEEIESPTGTKHPW